MRTLRILALLFLSLATLYVLVFTGLNTFVQVSPSLPGWAKPIVLIPLLGLPIGLIVYLVKYGFKAMVE